MAKQNPEKLLKATKTGFSFFTDEQYIKNFRFSAPIFIFFFIAHLSFANFHEGNRFKDTIFKAQRLTKTRVKLAGSDAIYTTNANRKFVIKNNIRTDFKRKGRASKHEKHQKQMAKAITKDRASQMEGSFDKEKQHYHLRKIKAGT